MRKELTPPDFAKAKLLIAEYSKILKDVSGMLTLGAPETLLPATKDEIRQSIRAVVSHTQLQDMAGIAAFGEMRAAYMALANFIPYEEANAAARLRAAFSSKDHAYLASAEAQQIMVRVRRMEEEAARLGVEFDRLANSDAWGDLDDVNALLAELRQKSLPPQPG